MLTWTFEWIRKKCLMEPNFAINFSNAFIKGYIKKQISIRGNDYHRLGQALLA